MTSTAIQFVTQKTANLPFWRRNRGAFAVSKPASEIADGEAVLGRLGSLTTRLARDRAEIRQAQALRYQVFFREMNARPRALQSLTGRDRDQWDPICDHLLVIEETPANGQIPAKSGTANNPGQIVGTYRFLRDEQARAAGKPFYTQTEFDIEPLLERQNTLRFMELGRSCVLPQWRDRRSIELLWHGTWAYVLQHHIDVLIGCASFPGSDPAAHSEALSFLYHHAAPDDGWQVEARTGRGVSMDLLDKGDVDMKRAIRALPPLIKGYLRLGARFAGQAVIDRHFDSTDVLVILPVADINPRYVNHYGADAGRHARQTA